MVLVAMSVNCFFVLCTTRAARAVGRFDSIQFDSCQLVFLCLTVECTLFELYRIVLYCMYCIVLYYIMVVHMYCCFEHSYDISVICQFIVQLQYGVRVDLVFCVFFLFL